MYSFFQLIGILVVFCPDLTVIIQANSVAGSLIDGSSGDRATLLSFKSGVWGNLSDWGSTSSMCNWTGVRCGPRNKRVVCLFLKESNLHGVISPAIGNLSMLKELELNGNNLSGSIPPELGMLSRLMRLSLHDNFLKGPIPATLGLLKKLTYVSLNSNNLIGSIPSAIFCNCSNLRHLDLNSNFLTGEIPLREQCRLPYLAHLSLYTNRLVGEIPPSVTNYTGLEWVLLQTNFLNGVLPSQMFNKMPRLKYLHLSQNNFSSDEGNTNLEPFIASLMNCTYLQELGIIDNGIGGEIPPSIGNLSANLSGLYLSGNNIFGMIPPGIGNLNLTELHLFNNLLKGPIPPEISRQRWLAWLDLSNNFLAGEIPPSIGEGGFLSHMDFSQNYLQGPIPTILSNLSLLETLILRHNKLSGAIPPNLGCGTKLGTLDLSYNKLTGQIPTKMAKLSSFYMYLNLSNNLLEGPLPLEIGHMEMTLALDFSSNNLSGVIPTRIKSCIALEYINLSRNMLQGCLPVSIGSLPNLHVIDVSFNKLTGIIPRSLQASPVLQNANFSYNNFSGEVPSEGAFANLTYYSFLGNPSLCGSIPGMARCIKRRHVLIVVITIASFLLLLAVAQCLRKIFPKLTAPIVQPLRSSTQLGDTAGEKGSEHPRISHRELVDATDGFSEVNLVGKGGCGYVYKGVLHDGTAVAVKVLHNYGSETTGSFERECRVVGRIRHRNLIRVITTCSMPEFKAFVLPFMLNGSLESFIHPPGGKPARRLDMELLLSIASNVAEGMAYLHHHAPFRIVHCDLKLSNVLLDEDMTAVVSDFGISKLIGDAKDPDERTSDALSTPCNSITGLIQGSVGYIAPEYGLGGRPSTQGDVYSFGVVLLEMISGKRPIDVINEEGYSLHDWVKNRYPDDMDAILDRSPLQDRPSISDGSSDGERLRMELVVEFVELGIACSQLSPSLRPGMVDVAQEITYLKDDAWKKYRVGDMKVNN